MQRLDLVGAIMNRFDVGSEHLAILPAGTAAVPAWRVVNYITRESVSLSVAAGAPGSVTGFSAHAGRQTITVDSQSGGVLNEVIAAARAAAGTSSVSAFLGNVPAWSSKVELAAAAMADGTYLYAARPGGSGIAVFRYGSGDTLTALTTVADTGSTYAAGVSAMAVVSVGTRTLLYTGSVTEHGINAWTIGAGGALTSVDREGPAQGAPLNAVTALRAVAAGDTPYLIAAAAGSSSLTVFRIASDGRLTLTDHVIDDLATRFDNVVALDALAVGDRVFVAAAGADDGVSLFSLTPDGRLVHLSTLADGLTSGLANVSALRMVRVGNELQILVGSAAEAGLTVLRVDLSAQGAVIAATAAVATGTAGADLITRVSGQGTLEGGGGDDILIDGSGTDALRGGSGADIFVLTADGQEDTILDFAIASDRIDLSRWAFLRSPTQLAVTATANGATLQFLDELLRIVSADGRPLTAAQILALTLIPVTRAHLDAELPDPPPEGQTVTGTSGNDTLAGGALADTIFGGGGNDLILGGPGADSHFGGAGRDTVSYVAETAPVRLHLGLPSAGSGAAAGDTFDGIEAIIATGLDDTLTGDSGANDIFGAAGADLIEGGDGNDTLSGGSGNDTLSGGGGNDLLEGSSGNDRMSGGDGDDTLNGSSGTDLFFGGAGRDWASFASDTLGFRLDLATPANSTGAPAGETFDSIEAFLLGSGNDTLIGGATDDEARGGAGDDFLEGNDGHDSLSGETGHDIIGGGNGDDQISGDDGNDSIAAGDGNDTIDGGTGNDEIGLGIGNDSARGGSGDDTLRSGPGLDSVWGEDGHDILGGGPGSDVMYGGAGDDIFAGGPGNDTIDGGDGADNIGGGDGNDSILGGEGNDTVGAGNNDDFVFGGGGDDALGGGEGADRLYGGTGADRLGGAFGDDSLWGGAGADTFVIHAVRNGETDRIWDFEDGIDRVAFSRPPPGTQAQQFAALDIATRNIDGRTWAEVAWNGHRILIADTRATDLSAADFIFG
jgi:Ca2+-binding RTX toxin-like protein